MSAAETHIFLAGELVEVLSAAEIAATLDMDGRLDGMPFMPEMLACCGRKLKVSRRADKTCVEGFLGMRKLGGTVFLEEAGRALAAASGALADAAFEQRMRIPEAFRCQDLTHQDVCSMVRLCLPALPEKDRPIAALPLQKPPQK